MNNIDNIYNLMIKSVSCFDKYVEEFTHDNPSVVELITDENILMEAAEKDTSKSKNNRKFKRKTKDSSKTSEDSDENFGLSKDELDLYNKIEKKYTSNGGRVNVDERHGASPEEVETYQRLKKTAHDNLLKRDPKLYAHKKLQERIYEKKVDDQIKESEKNIISSEDAEKYRELKKKYFDENDKLIDEQQQPSEDEKKFLQSIDDQIKSGKHLPENTASEASFIRDLSAYFILEHLLQTIFIDRKFLSQPFAKKKHINKILKTILDFEYNNGDWVSDDAIINNNFNTIGDKSYSLETFKIDIEETKEQTKKFFKKILNQQINQNKSITSALGGTSQQGSINKTKIPALISNCTNKLDKQIKLIKQSFISETPSQIFQKTFRNMIALIHKDDFFEKKLKTFVVSRLKSLNDKNAKWVDELRYINEKQLLFSNTNKLYSFLKKNRRISGYEALLLIEFLTGKDDDGSRLSQTVQKKLQENVKKEIEDAAKETVAEKDTEISEDTTTAIYSGNKALLIDSATDNKILVEPVREILTKNMDTLNKAFTSQMTQYYKALNLNQQTSQEKILYKNNFVNLMILHTYLSLLNNYLKLAVVSLTKIVEPKNNDYQDFEESMVISYLKGVNVYNEIIGSLASGAVKQTTYGVKNLTSDNNTGEGAVGVVKNLVTGANSIKQNDLTIEKTLTDYNTINAIKSGIKSDKLIGLYKESVSLYKQYINLLKKIDPENGNQTFKNNIKTLVNKVKEDISKNIVNVAMEAAKETFAGLAKRPKTIGAKLGEFVGKAQTGQLGVQATTAKQYETNTQNNGE